MAQWNSLKTLRIYGCKNGDFIVKASWRVGSEPVQAGSEPVQVQVALSS